MNFTWANDSLSQSIHIPSIRTIEDNSRHRSRADTMPSVMHNYLPKEEIDENTIVTLASLGLDDQESYPDPFEFNPFSPQTQSLLRPRAISLGIKDHFSPFPVPSLCKKKLIDTSIQPEDPAPSRSLWLGNICPSLTIEDLTQQFNIYGSIESIRILAEKECAFVNFYSVDSAVAAKTGLEIQDNLLLGTSVRVGFGKADVTVTDCQGPTRALWVGNLPPSANLNSLQNMFEQFGQIESVRILSHKNCGFINFQHQRDAVRARIALQNSQISGHSVRIRFAKAPEQQENDNDEDYQVTQWTTALMMANIMTNNPSKQQPVAKKDLYSAIVSERLYIMNQLGLSNFNSYNANYLPLDYQSSISPVPELGASRKLEPILLREIKKVLEGDVSEAHAEIMAAECMDDIVELCSDYIGNTVVQKLFDSCSPDTKFAMLKRIAPYLAPIGVHKNGTWVAQKMIDTAEPEQMELIKKYLAPYVPLLLLDQFGNYVVQCCLAKKDNQYIFDAIAEKCWEVGQGRFGARAVRSILESPTTNQEQRLLIASAIVQNAALLSTNPNGILLLNWFLDTSKLPNRYRVLCPRLLPYLNKICSHKLGSLTVQKIIQQTEEKDSASLLLDSLSEKFKKGITSKK